jgi:hypothetical protein
MNRVRNSDKQASLIAMVHGLGSCAALFVACTNPGTTSIMSNSRVDASQEASDDQATDAAPTMMTTADADATTAADSSEAEAADASAPEVDVAPGASDGTDEGDGDATGPQVCGLSACPPGAPCPDLTVDRFDLLASIIISERTFMPNDCAVAEGCVTVTGTRKLLRFDTGTVNSGTADLVIGDPKLNACFTFSQCHQHNHFRGVGHYTLYQSDGATVAAVGHKQGFCVDDVVPYPQLQPPPPDPAVRFDCNNQGLHIGWEDVYPNDIDCQWIDITGVSPGQYVLSVKINEGHYLPESNYDNNEARVPVMIP